jgi:hypothetical protein
MWAPEPANEPNPIRALKELPAQWARSIDTRQAKYWVQGQSAGELGC